MFLSVCHLNYHVCCVVAVITRNSQNGAPADAVRESQTQMLQKLCDRVQRLLIKLQIRMYFLPEAGCTVDVQVNKFQIVIKDNVVD